MANLQAVRGMNDILPEDAPYWQFVSSVCAQVSSAYHYQQIRFPVVESTALFKRSIGEMTDIIEKEMYTFEDRNGDSLTLRPEGTACCVRAALEHGLLHNQIQRLWYLGPMYRHERPQKGRYREFYQLGVEAFGMPGPEADVELISLSRRLFQSLGLLDGLELQINTLGTPEARAAYRAQLVAYYTLHQDQLDADSQRRLTTNPLRILDSKNPEMQALNAGAPKLLEHLDAESRQHFERVCALLASLGIAYKINPKLVRGLDYYCHTVFEWVTNELGAQGTVCAGGRYDGLVEQLGGKSTPAVGFAMGLERVILLLKEKQVRQCNADIYCVLVGDAAVEQGLKAAEQLRDACPQLAIVTNVAGGSFKAQMKRANKSGARWAFIVGEDEAVQQVVTLKDLRQDQPQQALSVAALIEQFKQEEC
jgi:histidyl-tRNA synthetase